MNNWRVLSLITVMLLMCNPWAAAADRSEAAVSVALTTNINEDDAQTMARVLEGVGLRKAEAIVAYREQHGRFYLVEELTAVKGIGKSLVQRNAARIVLDNAAATPATAVNSM